MNLVNDFDGECEVGGLFVDPECRGHAIGTLAARARYLFIARHRDWFGQKVIAELRGYQDEKGRSPVWEAVGRHFYDMEFVEADRTGALAGNQFIADLGPRYPLYVSLLPRDAQAALGRPHDDGRAAMAMLLAEGFSAGDYIDIFDGGPTLVADIDAVRTVRNCQAAIVSCIAETEENMTMSLIARGEGTDFRVSRGLVTPNGSITEVLADVLQMNVGDQFHYVPLPAGAIMKVPFDLPERPAVTRVRRRDTTELLQASGTRTQDMGGFEEQYTDIVDYIVRITDEIWMDRAVGRIYDTYDASCTIYSSYGVTRSVEEVIAGTITTLNAFPDGEIHHVNVAWSGDDQEGFYTSHLGHSRSTNVGRTGYGPPTGRKASIRFAADCVSRDNRIHTEWLVRDAGAQVRQLGFDLHNTARRLAEAPPLEMPVVSPETRLEGQAPRQELNLPMTSPDGWGRNVFHNLWNLKRFDWLEQYYSPTAVVHAGGGRVAQGLRNIGALLLHIQAAIPDGVLRVEHVCHSEETDGVIVAVRWLYEGTTAPGGVLGECPAGKPVFMMGISHLRFAGGHIVEEWMVFDELGVLTQAYR